MLIRKPDGTYIDTHELQQDPLTEEQMDDLETIGNDIIEDIEEYYIDNCRVIVESWEGGKELYVDDAPDYEGVIKDTIEEYSKKAKLSEQEIEYLTDYVNDNVSSERTLQECAMDNWRDKHYDNDPY